MRRKERRAQRSKARRTNRRSLLAAKREFAKRPLAERLAVGIHGTVETIVGGAIRLGEVTTPKDAYGPTVNMLGIEAAAAAIQLGVSLSEFRAAMETYFAQVATRLEREELVDVAPAEAQKQETPFEAEVQPGRIIIPGR